MLSMFVFGISGGVVAAWFAWPFGYVAAVVAYVLGGALCALMPALVEWRLEVVRGRKERREAASAPPTGGSPRIATTVRRTTCRQ